MIYGLGVDIVEIQRIRRIAERKGSRFFGRVFTKQELSYCFEAKDPYPRLASRFAAKEAVLKAMGEGLRKMKWKEIEVSRDNKGKPQVKLSGKANITAQEKGIQRIHISLTHSRDYAAAQAVAWQEEKANENR